MIIRPTLSTIIHQNFKRLRDEKHLLDFTVVVDDNDGNDVSIIAPKEFKVHKALLAACSPYFKAMLSHNSIESQESKVTLREVKASSIESILEYCYTSNIELDNENIQDILFSASLLQIDGIVDLCVAYIKNRINISNCLSIMILADRCNLQDLYTCSLDLCLEKFEDVIQEQEFIMLDHSWVARIIQEDALDISNEEVVFQAVVRWLTANQSIGDHEENSGDDSKNRLQYCDELMAHVRFALLDPMKLIKLEENELIRSSPRCLSYISKAKSDIITRLVKPEEASPSDDSSCRPRSSLRSQQRVFVLGGWTNTNEYQPFERVEEYDPERDEWREVCPMSTPRCGLGVAILDDFLYAIGGHDGVHYLSTVERYDIKKRQWLKNVANMRCEKTSMGVVALDGYIYTVGGQLDADATSGVDRYNPKTDTWEQCADMSFARIGAGVTVLDGYIYALGGAGLLHETLRSVERYDPKENKWDVLVLMIHARKHFGCAAYNGKIYAIGGRDNSGSMDNGECYDPLSNSWDMIEPMKGKRSGLGLVELDGLLYAIGGTNGDVKLKRVEAYNPQKKVWIDKKPMISERLGAGHSVYFKKRRDTTCQL